MQRLVTVSLSYTLTADNENAMEEAVRSLKQSYAPRQGRTECVSGCGRNGSYEARCTSMEAQVEG